MEYPWPGNVRELKSVINRACANAGRGLLKPENIIYIFPAPSLSFPIRTKGKGFKKDFAKVLQLISSTPALSQRSRKSRVENYHRFA
jgi:transcriptional regulator with AAA-type ATPase domain